MGRLVVLLLLAVIAVWLVRRALRPPADRPDSKPASAPGLLVRCAHCGVHLPRAEARRAEGGEYCSEEHAQLGPGRR